MEQYCKKSCGFCSSLQSNEANNNCVDKADNCKRHKAYCNTEASTMNTQCFDKVSNCQKLMGYCNLEENTMKNFCNRTCGFCGVKTAMTTTYCVDTVVNCKLLKRFCGKQPMMIKWCPLTCNVCKNDVKTRITCTDFSGNCTSV